MAGEPKEGDVGTTADGRKVVYLDGAPRLLNNAGMADMGGGIFKNLNGQTWREGPHGGFTMIAGPTTAEVDKHAGKANQINASLRGVDALDKKLRSTRTIGPLGWVANPNDLSELEGLNANLLGRLKEQPYNLGVLAGPDMGIMEAVSGNPAKLKDAAFRRGYQAKLRNVARDLGNGYRDEAKAVESTGGRRSVLPNLYQAPDSSYTPEEFGSDGLVPASRYGGNAGARTNVFSRGATPQPAQPKAAGGPKIRVYNPATGRLE
jgi:hypothetical protein